MRLVGMCLPAHCQVCLANLVTDSITQDSFCCICLMSGQPLTPLKEVAVPILNCLSLFRMTISKCFAGVSLPTHNLLYYCIEAVTGLYSGAKHFDIKVHNLYTFYGLRTSHRFFFPPTIGIPSVARPRSSKFNVFYFRPRSGSSTHYNKSVTM